MRSVGQGIRKKDSAALLSGKPVYTEDVSPKNCRWSFCAVPMPTR